MYDDVCIVGCYDVLILDSVGGQRKVLQRDHSTVSVAQCTVTHFSNRASQRDIPMLRGGSMPFEFHEQYRL